MEQPFTVIYEDNHLLVVNKASGILVQGDETGDTPLVELCKEYIKEKYKKPGAVFLGVVHRLDRPVSGIVVLARTSKALERMNALFREKQTRKTYWAVVDKKPKQPEDKLVHWLLKDEKKNKTTAFPRKTLNALESELSYKLIKNVSALFLLQVNPITGRPHQIRVQLASIGCPIVGDVKYGSSAANSDGSICLHAKKLEFVHPVKNEPMTFEAEPPSTEYWSNFQNL
ncbi:RluA family pseudouridine synthase [Chryseosolibacter indicus]|uniref:RluA family pseudouridine synthase n=1 Tax=Chryseosolibacter indicus TaxID=2782351 RepID=A0ABS5VXF6_9BACT|nr:RluA family pseudouridine synthase [Chryseosolibacter indicus]MBT1704671.1 RluA family pseudouridine synthase [Chryseosolibacter indicus]